MSDTPRNDSTEDRGDDVYRDPTAPSEAPSYGPPSSSGTPERTEQLPTGGDTQQVPSSSSFPPPPPPPGAGSAPQNPYATPPAGNAPQNPYAAPAAGTAYPSQSEVAQGGAPGTPPPPGYGQAPAYGQPAYGQAPAYGNPGGSLSGNTIALLIVSGLLTIGGCGVGIPALVFAIIAVTKKDQASEMGKWTRWGWIALGVTVLLVVLGFVALFSLAAVGGSTSP